MGNITTIVVPDAATTPVNHTFNPVKVDGDTAYLSEQSAVSSLGYWPLALTQRGPLAGQTEKVYRTKLSLAMPIVYNETINGVTRPTLGYTLRATVEIVSPADSVLQNRKDFRKILVGIMNSSSFIDMAENQLNIF